MKIRTLAAVGGLVVSVLTAGCVASVAGQAQVDPGAIGSGLPSSSSTRDTGPSSSEDIGPGSELPSSGPTLSGTTLSGGTTLTIGPGTTLVFSTSLTVTGRTTHSDDKSVPLTPTSIPGVSADCNKVIAGITAFSALLKDAGDTGATISRASVETTLAAMPASGLPAAIQPDMTILRSLVSSAADKSVNELAQSLADGKAVTALEDLSAWTTQNCI